MNELYPVIRRQRILLAERTLNPDVGKCARRKTPDKSRQNPTKTAIQHGTCDGRGHFMNGADCSQPLTELLLSATD